MKWWQICYDNTETPKIIQRKHSGQLGGEPGKEFKKVKKMYSYKHIRTLSHIKQLENVMQKKRGQIYILYLTDKDGVGFQRNSSMPFKRGKLGSATKKLSQRLIKQRDDWNENVTCWFRYKTTFSAKRLEKLLHVLFGNWRIKTSRKRFPNGQWSTDVTYFGYQIKNTQSGESYNPIQFFQFFQEMTRSDIRKICQLLQKYSNSGTTDPIKRTIRNFVKYKNCQVQIELSDQSEYEDYVAEQFEEGRKYTSQKYRTKYFVLDTQSDPEPDF